MRLETIDIGLATITDDTQFELRLVKKTEQAAPPRFHIVLAELGEGYASIDAAKEAAVAAYAAVTWRGSLTPQDSLERPCPICNAPVRVAQRYPNRLCVVCMLEAVDDSNRPMTFSNSVGVNKVKCFVRGIPCEANEARFGGIVIQRIA